MRHSLCGQSCDLAMHRNGTTCHVKSVPEKHFVKLKSAFDSTAVNGSVTNPARVRPSIMEVL